jgi:glycosyltransferase involved in cell wall biosynthesis
VTLPLVSIVIPCYNCESFIKEAIDSALAQTYQNVEVIVINDGSTDNSSIVIESFEGRIRVESTINQGVQLARNRGLELARGEYIKFLDSDDVLLPDCIERQVSQASEFPRESRTVVYGDPVWTDSHLQPIRGYASRPQAPDSDPIAAIMTCSPLTSCPLHRRDLVSAVGGFDPFLITRHENNLHLRLVLAGVTLAYRSCLVYKYRQYPDDNRLSQASYTKMGAMYYHEVLRREQQLIEAKTGQALSSASSLNLARDFWTYGRVVLREGYPEAAEKYFDAARNLATSKYIVGNFPYPLLVKILGTNMAESVLRLSKVLKNK